MIGRAMIGRLILAGALLQLGASAQLQIFQFDGSNDTLVGSIYNAGAFAPGDTASIRFHVKNTGPGPVSVLIGVKGTGFAFTTNCTNPCTVSPLNPELFTVAFSPNSPGSYSAVVSVNTMTAIISAQAVPAALVSFGQAQLAGGATADFGPVEWGTSLTKTFTLMNPNSVPVSVGAIAVTGAAFSLQTGVSMPLAIAAGGSKTFQIAFAPQSATQFAGTLTIDQRTFPLTGVGENPPLPAGAIVVSSAAASSSQQMNVSIQLASASKVAGGGTLTMAFQPAPGLPNDPAIAFLSGPANNTSFTVAAGDSIGKFNAQPNIAFQTGTTAGTIVFTLTLAGATSQLSVPIAPSMVNVTTASSIRRIDAVDVNIAGFDNTHSVSQLGFTFYDAKGNTIQPGLIEADATSQFKTYFAANQAGGMFTLLATFPILGDDSTIASVAVQVTNSAGVTSAQRITLQ